ncbi:hypothetical protein [Hymenobacter sp. IS2118]|uniref:hypothetical protein n=1 Tax=Hymenobacter sp. IS2118 TaxID=1505605 RepID=UPI00126915CA|nr:hypothetical protein [Hymenobacter sp. IS2118]
MREEATAFAEAYYSYVLKPGHFGRSTAGSGLKKLWATMDPENSQESFCAAIGNIIAEQSYGPNGEETRIGTKHFRVGAKVYIIDWFPGTCDRVVVIGHHRKSNRPIKAIIKAKDIANLRVKSCYSLAAVRLIKEHQANQSAPELTQDFAEILCSTLPHWR